VLTLSPAISTQPNPHHRTSHQFLVSFVHQACTQAPTRDTLLLHPRPDRRYQRLHPHRFSLHHQPSHQGPGTKHCQLSGYPTSDRTFPSAKLLEGNSVRGIETVSLNEGQTSATNPDTDVSGINSQFPFYSGQTPPGVHGKGWSSRVSSRISSVGSLSQMPLRPRQISDRPKPSRRIRQLPPL
jgi:hypothetical protein